MSAGLSRRVWSGLSLVLVSAVGCVASGEDAGRLGSSVDVANASANLNWVASDSAASYGKVPGLSDALSEADDWGDEAEDWADADDWVDSDDWSDVDDLGESDAWRGLDTWDDELDGIDRDRDRAQRRVRRRVRDDAKDREQERDRAEDRERRRERDRQQDRKDRDD